MSTVHTYEGEAPYLLRESGTCAGHNTVMTQNKKPEAQHHAVENQTQSKGQTTLYQSNKTFVTNQKAPLSGLTLDQARLGKSHYCSIGFEPVNFNTGNFILEAEDSLQSNRENGWSLLRTYNTKSTETSGLFGVKWASDWNQSLKLRTDGSVEYRKGDGALVPFTVTATGYLCGTEEHIILEKNASGYVIKNGKESSCFDADGHLTSAQTEEHEILFQYQDGKLSSITGSDGTVLSIETDQRGQILSITEPGGSVTHYAYEEDKLISRTEADGTTVRYEYDDRGRMTKWFDAAGVVQQIKRCSVRQIILC